MKRGFLIVGLLLMACAVCLAPSRRLNRSGGGLSGATPPAPDILLWLKADAITGYSNGEVLSNWVDSGPYSMSVTQSIGSNRPIYTTSAINGLPAVTFNGTNKTGFVLPQMFTNQNAAEVFIMVKTDYDPPVAANETNSGGWNFASSDAVSGSHFPYTDGSIYDSFCTTARKTVGNPTDLLTDWRCYNTSSSNDTWIARLDFTQIFSTAVNVFTNGAVGLASSNRSIGRSGALPYALNGKIAEVLLYGRILSGTDRTNVQNYLVTKYGVTAPSPFTPTNLPGGPFEPLYNAMVWYEPSRGYTTNAGIATLPNLTALGSVFNLTNTTAGDSPIGQPAQLNGLDTIWFDGDNGNLTSVMFTNAGAMDVFLVSAQTNIGTGTLVATPHTVGGATA